MKHYNAQVTVMPLKEILDPQGKAVESGLHNMGLSTISGVRIGKQITFELSAEDEESAKLIANEACSKLLANQIMEGYSFTIQEIS